MTTIQPLDAGLLADQIAACLALADRLDLGHVAAYLEQARTLAIAEVPTLPLAA